MDDNCQQTDGLLGWINLSDDSVIKTDDNSGVGVFAAFGPGNTVISSNMGEILIAFSGSGDEDFDGLDDISGEPHGVCGCYTLKIQLDTDGHPAGDTELELAMSHADINMDGITDTSDLGILIGFFGWITP